MIAKGVSRRDFILSSAALAGGAGPALSQSAGPQVNARIRTEQGLVVGARENQSMSWKGIPFAQPPIGRLRGRVPQDPKARLASLDAALYRNRAVQQGVLADGKTPGVIGDEDCLYLNIWAPLTKQPGRLPVIVWIHGGGFLVGSGIDPVFAGDRYAADGKVVFVTINYRLNGWGYLFNPGEPGSSNIGLLDQMKALSWVRRNIENFGGDPENVTVMGESAGAMSTGHLLGTPMAAGLFDKAAIQSGATSHMFSHREQEEVAERLFSIAGLKSGDYDALFRLSTVEVATIFDKTEAALRGSELTANIAFHGAVDGVVLNQHPLRSVRPVPTIICHCKQEMATFAHNNSPTKPKSFFAKQPALCGPERWSAIEQAYKDSPLRTDAGLEIELWSDVFCGYNSLRLADTLLERGGKVWSYQFGFDGAAPWGAGHATDIAFTFYRGQQANPPGRQNSLPNWADPRARAVGETLWGIIVNFAHAGTPAHSGLPDWPQHDKESIPYMSIGGTTELRHDFIGAERRQAWAPVQPEQLI
jgi:para-nitrobenzyl esterase